MQDYNEEVLTQLTAPNLHQNLAAWESESLAGTHAGQRVPVHKPPGELEQDSCIPRVGRSAFDDE